MKIEYTIIHLTDINDNMDNHSEGLKCKCNPKIYKNKLKKEIYVNHNTRVNITDWTKLTNGN